MTDRILAGAAATITVTLVDQDGTATAPVGAVTVNITRADGTIIATGRSTTNPVDEDSDPIVGVYQAALTAAETATLDVLTCVWKDGGTARVTTQVEVAGGYYFSVAGARGFDPAVLTPSKYTDAQIIAARREVEDECERITGTAWVPRYAEATVMARGIDRITLPDPDPRVIRTVVSRDGNTTHTFTQTERDALLLSATGKLTRLDGQVFAGQVTVTYERGVDAPPADLRHACLTRLRNVLNRELSGVGANVTQLTQQGGTTMTLALPGRAGFETGLPDVDATYKRYSKLTPGFAVGE